MLLVTATCNDTAAPRLRCDAALENHISFSHVPSSTIRPGVMEIPSLQLKRPTPDIVLVDLQQLSYRSPLMDFPTAEDQLHLAERRSVQLLVLRVLASATHASTPPVHHLPGSEGLLGANWAPCANSRPESARNCLFQVTVAIMSNAV